MFERVAPSVRSRRTIAPVANERLAEPEISSRPTFAVCAAQSTVITGVRVRSSTSCSAYHVSGCTSADSRSSLPRR